MVCLWCRIYAILSKNFAWFVLLQFLNPNSKVIHGRQHEYLETIFTFVYSKTLRNIFKCKFLNFQMLSYNRANRAVALLCNHQRAVPKTHDTSMANLQAKIDKKTEEVEKAEREYKSAKKGKGGDADKKKAAVKRLLEQLNRLETQKTDKEENKQIALGTSKLNYLDPRISVAWCRKFEIPIEKVYNKTQREKFRWAIDMTDEDYEF